MCDHDPRHAHEDTHPAGHHEALATTMAGAGAGLVLTVPTGAAGSRRRRLWELPAHAHCPLIGVSLPIALLRRVVGKLPTAKVPADDYELHSGVVGECRRRTPLTELVQRELDRRHAAALRRAATVKTHELLALWWQKELQGHDMAGALWALLTHPRCDTLLQDRVLGEVHMLQHQVGSCQRADLQRLTDLADENALLASELALMQQRSTRQMQDQALRIERQQAQLVQLRAELIGRDTRLEQLRGELQELEAAVPGLKSRQQQARQLELQLQRIHDLERALLRSEQTTERETQRAEAAAEALRQREAAPTQAAAPRPVIAIALQSKAVLCVGGRQGSVPVYRQAIERVGGRFLHHDGGDEDGSAKLDASLAAADLVICQTGCVSHNAYWRVKDHCKRTGKRCMFVDTPSAAGLRRALADVTQAPPDEQGGHGVEAPSVQAERLA
jgi:hypothetical protein